MVHLRAELPLAEASQSTDPLPPTAEPLLPCPYPTNPAPMNPTSPPTHPPTPDHPPPTPQVKKCADAGADIVRITVQGRKEAEACMQIREQLFKDRCGCAVMAGVLGGAGVGSAGVRGCMQIREQLFKDRCGWLGEAVYVCVSGDRSGGGMAGWGFRWGCCDSRAAREGRRHGRRGVWVWVWVFGNFCCW